jgi:isoleucyl-tRNA synthetase
LLKKLYDKGYLYKGYTIQPYSPAAGTGLSSHELNQPGTYKDVKDMTAVAMFKVDIEKSINIDVVRKFKDSNYSKYDLYVLAWTTTPWTLPSNTALAVGGNIEYEFVLTKNKYSHKTEVVIIAKELYNKYFINTINAQDVEHSPDGTVDVREVLEKAILPDIDENIDDDSIKLAKEKSVGRKISQGIYGKDLEGLRYEQLLPFAQPTDGDAFKVIIGDFVTTDDGTGIVHIAPSFGADDFRVAKQNVVGSLTLVDKRGKFLPEVKDGQFLYGEEYVKEAYLTEAEKATELAVQKEKLSGVIHDTSKLKLPKRG